MFWKRQAFLVLTGLLLLSLLAVGCGSSNSSSGSSNGSSSESSNGSNDSARNSNDSNDSNDSNGSPDAQNEAAVNRGTLRIGIIPAQGSNAMQLGADKLAAVLADALSREVVAQVYPDYNGVVEAMGADKVHMAYLGPLTYVEAHERYGVRAIATQLINGEPFYHSYLIARADAPYASLEDVKAQAADIRMAFGDISSTSGSLIPGIALKEAGVFRTQQDNSFKSFTYTGDHTATALAVENGQQDVGAIDSAYFHALVAQGKVNGENLKVIWQSEDLFQYPWAVVPSISDAEVARIQEAMLAITDADILNAFGGASAFALASNSDYAAIREAALADGRLQPRS